MHNSIRIKNLELQVYLGWPEEERSKKQLVTIDIEIFFLDTPLACTSDNLQDALCYSHLVQTIESDIGNQSFRLIEHFTDHIYQLVKSNLQNATVTIHVTKYPNIPGLKGGVQFSRGD